MKRFIGGEDRSQVTLLPECLDDYIAEDNPVRVVDAYVEELDLQGLGSKVRSRQQRADRHITRRCCSRSKSTAT
jgi:transposase